jgi:hypothetical protein
MLDYDRCDGTGKVVDSIAAGWRVGTTGTTGTVMPDGRPVSSSSGNCFPRPRNSKPWSRASSETANEALHQTGHAIDGPPASAYLPACGGW